MCNKVLNVKKMFQRSYVSASQLLNGCMFWEQNKGAFNGNRKGEAFGLVVKYFCKVVQYFRKEDCDITRLRQANPRHEAQGPPKPPFSEPPAAAGPAAACSHHGSYYCHLLARAQHGLARR